MESKIQEDLLKILDDDIIKVKIDDDFDIPEYKSKNKRKGRDKKILVLSGGGIRGIAHIGVLYALDKLGILSKFPNKSFTEPKRSPGGVKDIPERELTAESISDLALSSVTAITHNLCVAGNSPVGDKSIFKILSFFIFSLACETFDSSHNIQILIFFF